MFENQDFYGILFKKKNCKFCKLKQPARCAHCEFCNKCVVDHVFHSLWINNCITY